MLPKNKTKKTELPSNFIALGSKKKEGTNNDNSSSTTNTSTTTSSANLFNSTINTKLVVASAITTTTTTTTVKGALIDSKSQPLKTSSSSPSLHLLIDPKTVREELEKALEQPKEMNIDRLNKIVLQIIDAIKQNFNKQVDLNFIIALSYAVTKKPQYFLEKPQIVEMLTNFLFTNKFDMQLIKPSKPPATLLNAQNTTNNVALIQQLICNLLYKLYENEAQWPDVFIKAYIDDALSERNWVDSDLCKEFVQNILLAFHTKIIPFSFENLNEEMVNQNSNSSSNHQLFKFDLNNQQQTKFFSSDIDLLIVEIIKEQMNKRTMYENKNLLKLLQISCGIVEIRSISINKLEAWLANPKLHIHAQDLLLAICVNCYKNDQSDREIISQIIKFKPKIKHQQHYTECIRELAKLNNETFEIVLQMAILNEFTQLRGQHNINIIQTIFNVNGRLATTSFAQMFHKILLSKEDNLRTLRSLLRETIKHSRQDFDINRFVFELLDDIRKKYPEFINLELSLRERFVVSICDLVTVCIFISITQQVKDAYSKRNTNESKEILSRYYQSMANIQCETVTWLQAIVRYYDISAKERVNCCYKVVFMNDKTDMYYNIDNWPPEHERATIFRVVSEIPVLYETLYQVLLMSDTLRPHFALDLQERLLKTSVLVHFKDNISTIKIANVDQYLNALFKITVHEFSKEFSLMLPKSLNPPILVVSGFYWKAIQILLILTALDPKGFGYIAWENYPTLRLLMEMIMTDDYNFPPQSYLTDEMTIDKFRAIENHMLTTEKQEIFELESYFVPPKTVINESNSKLFGQVIKFDPKGPPRHPPNDAMQSIRKTNNEYKLGQLLCRCRDPDYLLMIIKRQNATISLSWLSGLIESNIDCLDIMPIQCICEFIWNIFSGNEDALLKKPVDFDQLFKRIQIVLLGDDPKDINDTLSYFMNRLCSDKPNVRKAVLKILNKIFRNDEREINIREIFDKMKSLKSFHTCYKPVLLEYLRKAIFYELEANYIIEYIYFLCEQSLLDANTDLNNQSKLEINSIALDLSSFIIKRKNLRELIFNDVDDSKSKDSKFFEKLIDFVLLIIKLNEYEDKNENKPLIETLKTVKYIKDSEDNNHILFYHKSTKTYFYLNENLFNLCIYLIIKCSLVNEVDSESRLKYEKIIDLFFKDDTIEYINCDSFKFVLSDLSKYELLRGSQNMEAISWYYIDKQLSLKEAIKSLHDYFGLPKHIIELLLRKIDFSQEVKSVGEFNVVCADLNLKINPLVEILKLYVEDVNYDFKATNKFLNYLILDVENSLNGHSYKNMNTFYLNNDESETTTATTIEKMDVDVADEYENIDDKDDDIKKQNALCEQILKQFEQKQHEQLIIKTKNLKLNNELNANSQLISQLNHLIQQMPNNLLSVNDKINYSIDLLYELISKTKINNLQNLVKNFFFCTNSTLINDERILIIIKFLLKFEHKLENNLIEMFIDLYVRLDQQIIDKQVDQVKDEFVFGKHSQSNNSTKIQTFLILLLTHQAKWPILHDCVFRLLDRNKKKFLKLNSKIVLDFLWSLIHIPTLWRGMDSVSNLDLYKEESILDLNEFELYSLIDLICDELLNEKNFIDNEIKYLFKKRIRLLLHFLNNKNRISLMEKLSNYLQKNLLDCFNESNILDINEFNEESRISLISIRNLLLYHLYLDEPTIVYNIRDQSCQFSNLYLEMEAPSKIDLKAHYLLSCFIEIDPIKKQDTSSLGKKQENLMIDANFVCLKLASTHPFIFIRYTPIMEGLLQGRVIYTFEEFKKRKLDKLFHYVIDLINILVPFIFVKQYMVHLESIISHYFDVFKTYSLDNLELGSLITKFMDFLEKFINNNLEKAIIILNKYSQLISYLQKSYIEISSLKYINAILSSSSSTLSTNLLKNKTDKIDIDNLNNLYIPKSTTRLWSAKQLDPFINKLLNRDNFDGVISVLQELDSVSQRQPVILNEFVHYLHDFLKDLNDVIRELTFSLVMRFLRLNPKESYAFLDVYCQCLNHENTKIFQSALKIFPDFTLLCSEKSKYLIKYAINGGTFHNIDVQKEINDAARLLNLEKFI